ncbi:MAG: hypothetical protein K0S93_457 [Nitrososphaeraceae archaeon]|jgi:hypothetical protein|nr:hypothetical protein [Nitrososphaeraceae archaeon]
MLIAEIFIRSLVEKYDLNPVYSDDGMEYPKVCNIS